jgi:hypothetical protein
VPLRRSARSHSVAVMTNGARAGLPHHSATAKEYCPSSSTVAQPAASGQTVSLRRLSLDRREKVQRFTRRPDRDDRPCRVFGRRQRRASSCVRTAGIGKAPMHEVAGSGARTRIRHTCTSRVPASPRRCVTGADFAEWRMALGLSLTEAAKLLEVGRRTIMGYLKKDDLPPVVAIACRVLARDKHVLAAHYVPARKATRPAA